jgi:hypothetical protein
MRGLRIRWPIAAVALAALLLMLALLGWHYVTSPADEGPTPSSGRTNLLLLGRSDSVGGLREVAVASLDPASDALVLAIPSDLQVKDDDGTLVLLESVFLAEGGAGVCDALGGLLGIDIDGEIQWDDEALAGCVEEVGGLTLTAEADVSYEAVDGESRIEVRVGEQTLGGREALAYVRGASTESALLRQQRLLRALLERAFLGQETRAVRETARAMHALLETDLTLSGFTNTALALREIDGERLRIASLPTQAVTVDGESAQAPQAVETERLVATLIRGLELLTPSEVQVAVFNGNGVRLMASRTADYLRARGFQVTRIANAESFDYPTSYIVVLSDEAKAWVLRDALPSSVSIVFPDAFEEHYEALSGLVPFGTDLLLIAGAGMEIE